ncbi:MAG: hypothetical protein MRY83_01820 [Flavobacteriales bacterium]|nr:hypothetical protein [Flavobacteriales bacterium]
MNNITICTLLFLMLSISGCKKWYDCECSIVQTQDSTVISTETIIYPTKDTEENATEFCDVYNTTDSSGHFLRTRTCELKTAPK